MAELLAHRGWILLLLVPVTVIGLCCFRSTNSSRGDASTLEASFVRSVPPGASRDTVTAWLRAQGVSDYGYSDGDHQLRAIFRDRSGGFLVRGSDQVIFDFDRSG